MNWPALMLTRIASWLIDIVCYDSMPKPWKPLSPQLTEQSMKGLEALTNDGHLNDDERGLRSEQFTNDLALLQHQQRVAKKPQPSLEWCFGCGMEIPEARRLAVPGVEYCIDCQKDEDRREFYR